MHAAAVEGYVAAFVAQCEAVRAPGRSEVEEPGVRGLLPSAEDPRARLLVSDDRAYDTLVGLVAELRSGMIRVFAGAGRCVELLERVPGWASETVTAMVCRDPRTVPTVPLPGELSLRPVRRLADDAPDGVTLEDAVAVATLLRSAASEPGEGVDSSRGAVQVQFVTGAGDHYERGSGQWLAIFSPCSAGSMSHSLRMTRVGHCAAPLLPVAT